MDEVEDPLAWELRQLQQLERLATMYGWKKADPKYQQRVKLIQQEGEARMKASKASHGAAPARVQLAAAPTPTSASAGKKTFKRAKPYGWKADTSGPKAGRRCSSFESAKKFLGQPVYGECWESDRDSPSGTGWRRYVAVDPANPENYCRARIVMNKGWPQ
jgi:hypothetical protein